jgi:RimJ/RimL family protein N-acetyltransferase
VIRTPRLILRDFRLSDQDAYCQLRAHKDFQRFYPAHELSTERSGQLLREFLSWATENPRLRFQLAIEEPHRGLVGSCGLRISEIDRGEASFGCELGREFWGRGYALEASRALIGYGFSELGVHRVVAETLAENSSARSLALRLGMRGKRLHRKSRFFRDRCWDTITLSILASEWEW